MIGNRRRLLMVGGVLLLLAVVWLALRTSNAGVSGTAGRLDLSPPSSQGGRVEPGQPEPASPTVTPEPSAVLLLPTKAVIQWEDFTFSAEGFQPNEMVSLLADTGGEWKEIAQVEADGDGRIEDARVQLPSWLESGKREIHAEGASSGVQGSGSLTIRAKNLWINLSGHAPQPATNLGFVAGGFEPGDRVSAYLTESSDPSHLASEEPLATVTADDAGNTGWTEVVVPVVPPGKYTLLLKGENTREELKTSITVSPLHPQMELSPWSGLPGSSFDVNASGFLPGEQVDLYLGNSSAALSSYQADQWGGIWGAGPVAVPVQAGGGPLAVRLRGQSSGSETVAEFNVVAANPWLELNNYSGFAGTPVMAHGGGFAARERIVLHVGSTSGPVVAETVAAEDGSYSGLGPVSTPADAQGQVTFVAVGESSGAQATAVFKIVEPFESRE